MKSDPSLAAADAAVYELCRAEERRQAEKIRLIPSENYVSRAVLEATGTVFTNKYSEGYPQKRYYEGQQFTDPLEELAIKRAKKLFGADHANVQPYSGSPANLAVYFALLKPGDRIMGLDLPSGGHLTHGSRVSITGRYYDSHPYRGGADGWLDYDQIRQHALEEASRPEYTAYAQQVVKNAQVLAEGLLERGFHLVTGGTDNHLLLIDMVRGKGIPGWRFARVLYEAGLETNKNSVPDDPKTAVWASGLRIGSPAVTTRGMQEAEMPQIARWIRASANSTDGE